VPIPHLTTGFSPLWVTGPTREVTQRRSTILVAALESLVVEKQHAIANAIVAASGVAKEHIFIRTSSSAMSAGGPRVIHIPKKSAADIAKSREREATALQQLASAAAPSIASSITLRYFDSVAQSSIVLSPFDWQHTSIYLSCCAIAPNLFPLGRPVVNILTYRWIFTSAERSDVVYHVPPVTPESVILLRQTTLAQAMKQALGPLLTADMRIFVVTIDHHE
jgi:hypothetical protein